MRQLLTGLALLGLLQLSAGTAAGNDKSETPKSPDPEMVQRLLIEIQELRARVTDLETRLSVQLAATQPAAPVPKAETALGSPIVAPPAAPPTAAPAPASTPPAQEGMGGPPPGVNLRLFGDMGYHATDLKGDTNTFYVGSLDMFMTGRLTDTVSILGEVLFTSASDNSINPDVERLLLQYKANDHFSFGIGRYHTSIGYYNPIFHRGAWFQTAIGRPFMYAFDDDGGSFPLQEVGVTMGGHIPSGTLGLEYVAEVGNGRDHLLGAEPAQNHQDINNGKSFNLALNAHPAAIRGLDIGASYYHDFITFSDNINHSESISTVHIVYTNSTYEFLNEASLTRHVGSSTGGPGTFNTPGFYTQFSRAFGKYRPYFRYQYINAGVTEPIYGDPTDGPVVGRRDGPSAGLRWDFNNHAAWKLQFDHLTRRGSDTVSDRTVRTGNGLATEFSFAF